MAMENRAVYLPPLKLRAETVRWRMTLRPIQANGLRPPPIKRVSQLVLSAIYLGLATTALANPPPATLQLSQARQANPKLIAYLDVRDADGKAADALNAAQLTASLADTAVPVTHVQTFADSQEGVAYIFLVDVSLSLPTKQFAHIRTALAAWADTLATADRMALLSFGDSVKTVTDFSGDPAALKTAIAALKPTDQHTALHQGLIQALQLARRGDADLPGRRVLVVLSDGLDDLSGGATREEVLNRLDTDRIPIYALGWDTPNAAARQAEGIKALGLFARRSGGAYVGVGSRHLSQAYSELRDQIKAVAVATLDCRACRTDGRVQRLQITLRAEDGLVLNDGMDIRLLPALPTPTPPIAPSEPAPPTANGWPVWLYGSIAGVLLLLVTGVILVMRRRLPQAVSPPPVSEDFWPDDASWDAVALPDTAHQTPAIGPGYAIELAELNAGGHGKTYPLHLSGEAVIGRGADCAVTLTRDAEVSGHHCALVYHAKAVMLHDLGSTNGTYVNGVPISAAYRLQEGDIIGIGRTQLRVLLLGEA
ncbi:FHA domain-containing protein [Methylovulum psychrotolerans]|uniref:FHA domain-containing protein n=1 Tax=Methylovulum psychrotolerans TaxID=1704499 RepID=UPI001BFF8FFB|nr:FHA domain-containing protein [Methylovulum psychrotolerans]MBT9096168.1 FHA domain-containing protein [Methylovulum psychrotolerans]